MPNQSPTERQMVEQARRVLRSSTDWTAIEPEPSAPPSDPNPFSFLQYDNVLTSNSPIDEFEGDDIDDIIGEGDDECMLSDEDMPRANDFPFHDMSPWELDGRDIAARIWSRQMDYRLRWIFYREEREGVSRTRMISPFSPNDFKQRVGKTPEPHPANTPTRTFYDWKIGGADFLIRLESMSVNGFDCLRCHFIYRPNGKELCYQDRVWNGRIFNEVNIVWAGSI